MSSFAPRPESDSRLQDPVNDDDEEDDFEEDDVYDEPNADSNKPIKNEGHLDGTAGEAANTATPVQKRRRVTRACDECRRKKIKCDGKQPCTHCTVYSYECTYDQPSNRRRNPAPFYIHQLETRLEQCNAVLEALIPGVDIHRTGFDVSRFVAQIKLMSPNSLADITTAALQSANSQMPPTATNSTSAKSSALQPKVSAVSPELLRSPSSSSLSTPTTEKDNNIESMVASLGRLDVDETGHLDYVGHSSGRLFLQHVREHFLSDNPDAKLDIGPTSVFSSHSPAYSTGSSGGPLNMDSPSDYYYQQMAEFRIILPSKEVATTLIESVWDQACVVLRFGHRPSFQKRLDNLYATDPDEYSPAQINFLPLVYSFLAVGVLFSQDMRTSNASSNVGEGYKYFVAARKMIDITEARDTDSIQVIILMVMFLQNTARLSTCYSYIGIALRAALRLGLHRKVAFRFNPVEAEVRKRIFWTIRKMDIHISAMLGLPRCIDEHDIDQYLPLEIDDEYITETGILPHPAGTITLVLVSNLHTKLMGILSRIIEDVYPISSRTPMDLDTSIQPCVSYARVVELENELQQWLDTLPFELRPGIEPPPHLLQANKMLNLGFCYVKIILYRPFIHYVGQKYKDKIIDERPYACAANCISTSRIVVHLADDLLKRDVLRGAHLFAVYTIFFSTAVLIYYVHEDPLNPHVEEFRRDAELGRSVIERMKNKSAAAARTYVMLSGLFELLNKRMESVKTFANHEDPKRKRATHEFAGTSSSLPSRGGPRPLRAMASSHRQLDSHLQTNRQGNRLSPLNAVNTIQLSEVEQPSMGIGRASTFPLMGSTQDSSSPDGTATYPTQTSYDDLYAPPGMSTFTDSLGPAAAVPQPIGLDMSALASATSSNIDTMLYFPSLGATTNDGMESGFTADGTNLFDPNTQDPNMMAYSTGPMDKFEAQLFGRFLPPYMHAAVTDIETQGQVGMSVPPQAPTASSLDFVVDMGAVLGGGGPFMQDSMEGTASPEQKFWGNTLPYSGM